MAERPKRTRPIRRKKDPPLELGEVIITGERLFQLERDLRAAGYGDLISASLALKPPGNCRRFAREVVYVIVNSGMKYTVANVIFQRVMRALRNGKDAGAVFGHRGKAKAINYVWRHRRQLFAEFKRLESDPEKIAFCASLPWIGSVTKYHLAKNMGLNAAKPDIHLDRIAYKEGTTAWKLCQRLARETGYRESVVDTILWASCASGVIDSWIVTTAGWEAGYKGKATAWQN